MRMYLRTTKRRNADGSEVRYYQLAENIWDAKRGCAIAKVIYNFGRADQVDEAMLRRLAGSILRVLGEGVSGSNSSSTVAIYPRPTISARIGHLDAKSSVRSSECSA
jgi:hypothetical protein